MIDVTFDFTTDSKGYWDGFWTRNDGLGGGGSDPDKASPTLKEYHRLLWSKLLPNGEVMNLHQYFSFEALSRIYSVKDLLKI